MQTISIEKQEEILNHPEKVKLELQKSQEVQQLIAEIDIRDQISLLEFGKKPAEEISMFSNRILNTMSSSSQEESSALMSQLTKIMDRFDPKDFAEEKGLFSKLFNRGKSYIEKIMQKYQTMGGEIDKIYVEIKKYEADMKHSTMILEQLYEENYKFFFELEKYVVAAEMKAEELRTQVIPPLELRVENGDQMAGMQLDSMRNALELIEQRAFDLEMAKQVAFQSAPQIRMIQRGNTRLIAKINSAFVTTIPIFKNGLIQAITAKRQKVVADSMAELDKRTNEMLLKNVANISQQSKDIARLSGAPSIKVETMEQTWSIIMKGLEETKAIEDENAKYRETGRIRLQELQKQYEQAKGKTI